MLDLVLRDSPTRAGRRDCHQTCQQDCVSEERSLFIKGYYQIRALNEQPRIGFDAETLTGHSKRISRWERRSGVCESLSRKRQKMTELRDAQPHCEIQFFSDQDRLQNS